MIDISLDTTLKLAEIVSILVGGTIVAYRLGRTTERLEAAMATQRDQIAELQHDVKEVNKLLIAVALQDQRLVQQDQRLNTLTSRLDAIGRREEKN